MNNTMMQFEGVAALFGIFAIITLYIGYKLLASSSWLIGWVRGNVGIAAILLTGFLILCVIDIRSYKPMFDDKPVATLNLRQVSPQKFEVRLVDAIGVENRYSVTGAEWQLSANQFIWSKRLSLGLGHGYRFSSIAGLSATAPQINSGDTIAVSHYLDVWKLINSYIPNNIFLSTKIAVTTPQPLVDAALYEVVPSGFDLIVRPLNELAKRAQPTLNLSQPVASGIVEGATPNAVEPVSSAAESTPDATAPVSAGSTSAPAQ